MDFIDWIHYHPHEKYLKLKEIPGLLPISKPKKNDQNTRVTKIFGSKKQNEEEKKKQKEKEIF